MKVILCEDVDHLGPMGEIVNVARGYARNYLLPRRLAVVADSASAKQIEHEMRIIKKRENLQRETYQERIKGFEGITVEMTAKAGTEGKLYGSITSLHIAAKLSEMGHDVDRRKLVLSEPIRALGEHTIRLRLMKDVESEIKIVVTADTTVEEVVVEDDFVDLEEGGTAAEAEAKASVAKQKRKRKEARATKTVEAETSASDTTDVESTEDAATDVEATEETATDTESAEETASDTEPAPDAE